MELNRISSVGGYYNNGADRSSKNEKASSNPSQEVAKSAVEPVAAVYEPSKSEAGTLGKTYTPDTQTIAQLKAEVDRRTENLRSLVEQLLLRQGYKFNEANNIYKLLREGKIEVDPETAAKAQEEISEDGYWGVKQTSERIFSFAMAITGGDPSKAQAMKEAVIKGYKQAEKIWGGELPEISKRTYEETLKKFDEWINDKEQENVNE